MAKKAEEGSREKRVKDICALINKGDFGGEGHDAVTWLGSRDAVALERFPSGCEKLDDALGGGWPKGRFIEIYGPESGGKTTLVLHAIAEYQKKYPDEDVALVDSEYSFDEEYAGKLGVNTKFLMVNQPTSGAQALNVIRQLIQAGVKLVIMDSVAALTTEAELAGDLGDMRVAEQARMMSSALRTLTTEAGIRKVTMIFTNQVREKIGVCFEYHTPILLEDGKTEWIGKIVNQKMNVGVMSFDSDTGLLVPKRIRRWVNNGTLPLGETFVKIRASGVPGKGKGGLRGVTATKSHRIFTPTGERSAGDIVGGDKVLVNDWQYFSPEHHELILGSILGDGGLRFEKGSPCGHVRFGHGPKQAEYCRWKASCFGVSAKTDKRGVVWFDTMRTQELEEYKDVGKKKAVRSFPESLICRITPKVVAVWYQDDGNYSGSHERWGWGKCSIAAKCLPRRTLEMIALHLRALGMGTATVKEGRGLEWNGENSCLFQQAIAPFVHHSMRYKIKKGMAPFSWCLNPMKPVMRGYARMVTRVGNWLPPPGRRGLFDLEIEGHHSYVAGGVIVHNTYGDKTTTPAGRALKHYASVRVQIARIGTVKEKVDGEDVVVSAKTKADVKKNKTAPPFRRAEFCISFGRGIDRVAEILDTARELEVFQKRGASLCFDGEILGAGRGATLDRMRQDEALTKKVADAVAAAKTAAGATGASGSSEEGEKSLKRPPHLGKGKKDEVLPDDEAPEEGTVVVDV